ncbi:hypothetical protein LXL04_008470 [Taraxacum kok-saghyz]
MAWLRGKVAIGSFPDLAGAVNKISESVKNIEKNFDNALGLEDQPGGSTSTVDASQAESSSHGNLTVNSSKKPEPSEIYQSTEKQESSKEAESSDKHESSTDPSISKEKEGIDNINISPVRDANAEISNPEEHHVETLKPQEHEHQHHPEEVDNSGEKSMDTNYTVSCEQADGNVGIPKEPENIAKKPLETDTATSDKATAISDNHIEAETDSQPKPSTDDIEDSENSEICSTKNPGSVQDQLAISVDQIATTSSDLQLNIRETETTQNSVVKEVDATYDGQSAVESEPHEVNEIVKEGQPSLLQTSENASEKVPEVVSKDDNDNDRVHTTVEVATLKSEMKKMEAALLGAARQALAKADEISKLMNENEQLKLIIDDQMRKSNEADIEALREECHQRVSTLERKYGNNVAAPHLQVLEGPVEAPTSSNSVVANPATDSAVINTATDPSSVSTGLDTPPDPEIH